jgi:predicted deacylase
MIEYELMNIRKRLIKWAKDMWNLPLVYRVIVIVFLTVSFLYLIIFLPPKEAAFSYAAKDTCVSYFTFFPGWLRQSGDTSFKVRAEGIVSVGAVVVASTKACISPAQAPTSGTHRMAVSLSGGGLFRKEFIVRAGTLPVADVSILNKPVPTSRPLSITLNVTDKVFDYRVEANGKSTACAAAERSIVCDTPNLGLLQGRTYGLRLKRTFQTDAPQVIADKKIVTLAATRVVKTSIKNGSTIYSKPRSFEFAFDKPLKTVTPQLYAWDGKKKQLIQTTNVSTGKNLSVKVAAELPRSKTFTLTLTSLQATDGSSLASPYTLTFKTSGGPRVTGVNMGPTGIPTGSTIAISFDQTLSASQNITKLISLTGGASFAGKSANQVYISLASVPRCSDFSIKFASGIRSNYEIAGNSAWSFSGRTVCHTTQTIGYSALGRPITAYVFGSGSAVLYTGAIHGNEVSTASLMYYWVDELEANARAIPAGRSVVVVPEVNPDGVAAGSRTNAHNIDLNRNFATSDWRKDITDVNNNPFPGGGGSSPMSEPETRVIAGYAQRLRPSLILSYHSIGGVVAANQAGASNAYAATYSKLSGYGNITGQSSETFDYEISGTADDWYAQKAGIASVLVELGSHTYSQFSLNRAAMWAMLR